MAKISLVALYGAKPGALKYVLESILRKIRTTELGACFKPYSLEQVHSTLIGMESLPGSNPPINANRLKKLKVKTEMNFSGFAERVANALPLAIQIGGFEPSFDGFTSLGALPYARSFQINWKSGRVILMGWPMEEGSGIANQQLLTLRETMETHHHIQHKYEGDNDFYMVLGQLESLDSYAEPERRSLQEATQQLEQLIRDYLVQHPLTCTLHGEDISLVRYEQETLELDSTEQWPLNATIGAGFWKDLFAIT